MKSLIASLRSLTLPFGATSGPRIVLNGVLGRIEIYSDAGNLLMTLDDDGLIVYDADGDQRQKIGSISDFSSIVFRDEDGLNPAIITYQSVEVGDVHRTLGFYAPDIGGGGNSFSRLFILTPTNAVKNPLLQWDTGFLDPGVAQPIVDLTGFTGDLAARTVVHDLWRGDSLGGGNAPNVETSYPRGIIAIGKRNTAFNYEAEATVLTLPTAAVLEEGRRYRFAVGYRAMSWGTAAANGISLLRVRDSAGGTIRLEHHEIVVSASAQDGATATTYYDCPADIAAGSYSFVLTAQRALGAAGTHSLSATNAHQITLIVEDMGATT
jgi:hypothetical protein